MFLSAEANLEAERNFCYMSKAISAIPGCACSIYRISQNWVQIDRLQATFEFSGAYRYVLGPGLVYTQVGCELTHKGRAISVTNGRII